MYLATLWQIAKTPHHLDAVHSNPTHELDAISFLIVRSQSHHWVARNGEDGVETYLRMHATAKWTRTDSFDQSQAVPFLSHHAAIRWNSCSPRSSILCIPPPRSHSSSSISPPAGPVVPVDFSINAQSFDFDLNSAAHPRPHSRSARTPPAWPLSPSELTSEIVVVLVPICARPCFACSFWGERGNSSL